MLLGTNGKSETDQPALEGPIQDLLLNLCSEGSGTGDLSVLVSSLAERVCRLFQARTVAVWLKEGERFRMAAVAADSPEQADEFRHRYTRAGFPEAEELAARARVWESTPADAVGRRSGP